MTGSRKSRADDIAGLLRERRFVEAADAAEHFAIAHPQDPEAHRLRGFVASAAGDRHRAIVHFEQACRLAPASGELRCELGRLRAGIGDVQAALGDFEACTRLAPGHLDGWYFLGLTFARARDDARARAPLSNALALSPGKTEVLRALADVEFRSGHPDDALPLLQTLARQRPADIDVRLKLGETLSRLARTGEAVQEFNGALGITPDSPDLWIALAQAQEDAGDRAAATAAYERALALRPNWALPISGLLGIQRAKAPQALVDEALELMRSPSLPDADRALLGYQLGKVHDLRGDHAQALPVWDQANAARRRLTGDFDRAEFATLVDRTIRTFPPAFFAAQHPRGSEDARPVFVVGMPRSGTTLTEQIIASHPLASGAGELPDIALLAQHMASGSNRWPESMPAHLDATWLASAADRWLAAAGRNATAGSARLVDKAPLNFLYLGLVALLFPNARVVWCRRDPRDIAISIYSENFSLDARFSTRIDDILFYTEQQTRLMHHWQQSLPLPIHELSYETLVTEPLDATPRLIEFTGLPWHADCLQFHNRQAGVQTPSRWQVREPMHTRSIGRWRHYAQAFQSAPGSNA